MAIVGPTAIGKSSLALDLVEADPGLEIVSVDSMQVYRGMDIGTAKPSTEEQQRAPHHMIDLVEPSTEHTVADFQAAAAVVAEDLTARGARALLVGGTGLYVRAVVEGLELAGRYPAIMSELESDSTETLHRRLAGLDPVAASRIDPSNRRRTQRALEVTLGSGRAFSSFGPGFDRFPAIDVPILGLRQPREELDARLERRFAAQMAAGFLDEVERVVAGGWGRTAQQALGYRELAQVLVGAAALDDAIATANRRIRRFARRQERWFRRDPRIHWCDDTRLERRLDLAHRLLEVGG